MSTATALAPIGQWSRTALNLPDQMTFDDWMKVGEQLHACDASVLWWIGDWLLYGENTYAERFAKAIQLTGYTQDRLKEARRVAAAFPREERSEEAAWELHRVAANLPREVRVEAVREAAAKHWSIREFKAEVARRAAGGNSEPDQATLIDNPAVSQTLKRTTSVVQAAFRDWFGIGDEYARVILCLYQSGGKPQDWRVVARFVSTHKPMSRGAVHEAISTLRETFESEAIDRDDDGYWLTEIGQAECRRAFRELGQQLIAMGAEAANDG
jgi:hypothetical protein